VSSRRAPDRALLLANHGFPGEYVIKAFGPGSESFRHAVTRAADAVVEERRRVSERATRSGRSICITLRLQAHTVDEVIEVYNRLYTLEELKLIL
jgi:putative lipoic acid-binding regulatory protein